MARGLEFGGGWVGGGGGGGGWASGGRSVEKGGWASSVPVEASAGGGGHKSMRVCNVQLADRVACLRSRQPVFTRSPTASPTQRLHLPTHPQAIRGACGEATESVSDACMHREGWWGG